MFMLVMTFVTFNQNVHLLISDKIWLDLRFHAANMKKSGSYWSILFNKMSSGQGFGIS